MTNAQRTVLATVYETRAQLQRAVQQAFGDQVVEVWQTPRTIIKDTHGVVVSCQMGYRACLPPVRRDTRALDEEGRAGLELVQDVA